MSEKDKIKYKIEILKQIINIFKEQHISAKEELRLLEKTVLFKKINDNKKKVKKWT